MSYFLDLPSEQTGTTNIDYSLVFLRNKICTSWYFPSPLPHNFWSFPEMRERTESEMIRFSRKPGMRSAVTQGSRHFLVGTQGQVHCGKGKVSISVLLSKVPFPCPAVGFPSLNKSVLKKHNQEKGQEKAFITQSFNPVLIALLYVFIVIYYFFFCCFFTTISVLPYSSLIAHPSIIHCLVPVPVCHTLLHTQSPPATQPFSLCCLPFSPDHTPLCSCVGWSIAHQFYPGA